MMTKNWVSIAAIALSIAGCKKSTESATPAASAAPPALASGQPESPRGPAIPIAAKGMALQILPGQGLGPIRIGATVATIERLMEAPCEEKDEKTCRYPSRAVEFLLDENGAAREMRVHRGERLVASGPRVYGIFKGRAKEGLAPMMLQPAVRGLYGAPLQVEPVKEGGPNGTVEIHTYNGMRIEFDRLANGTVVVGAIDIVKG